VQASPDPVRVLLVASDTDCIPLLLVGVRSNVRVEVYDRDTTTAEDLLLKLDGILEANNLETIDSLAIVANGSPGRTRVCADIVLSADALAQKADQAFWREIGGYLSTPRPTQQRVASLHLFCSHFIDSGWCFYDARCSLT
jgi:hypothetical protein